MLHVITSNPLKLGSIHRNNNNFIVVHTYTKIIIPRVATSIGYGIDIYHQDGMSLEEFDDYHSDDGIVYDFIPVAAITQALDMISDVITRDETQRQERNRNLEQDDDPPDESMVAVSCDQSWNKQASRYINQILSSNGIELSAIDLYSTLKIVSQNRLTEYLKKSLGTEFIYPEDPVSYGYAIHRVLGGIMH